MHKWYASALALLWSLPQIPDAKELAALIEKLPGAAPPDLPIMMERLRHWPPGEPFSPLPDNKALELRWASRDSFNPRSWLPGASPGKLSFNLAGLPLAPKDSPNETYFKKILGNPGTPPELRLDPDT